LGSTSTIDLEDYRRQYLRDYWGTDTPPHPREVQRELETALELLDACDATATFFTVGRLVRELPISSWEQITSRHRLGCHGHEHLPVDKLGAAHFEHDLLAAKGALEDVSGRAVRSYRAPYFSAEGCDPWFGDVLARTGIAFDSSFRFNKVPSGFSGRFALPGSQGTVWEVPMPSIGWGAKRLTVIGGTYFRLLPLWLIIRLLKAGARQGFVPLVYLHPYDLDASAQPIAYPSWRLRAHLPRAADRIRKFGRETAADKLRALARIYEFQPIEGLEGVGPGKLGDLVQSPTGQTLVGAES
jgi:hypothetical protein